MLKITSPFREKKEIAPLIEAGADELYCGYLSPEWNKIYTSLEFERKGGGANFTDLTELKQAVELAHKKNTPACLTLNGLYVKSQYPLLLKIIAQLEKIDFDAFIVADIGLILTLQERKTKKKIHISTGGTVFNSTAARFYKNLGASRIVLDRQTTLESMRTISADNPDVDFEVFILNTLCVYIDGFCTFLHTYGRDNEEDCSKKEWQKDEKLYLTTAYDPQALADACCLKYSIQVYDNRLKKINSNKIQPVFYKQFIDCAECGACAIYEINQTKIKSVKIVGRQTTPENRLKSVKFIRSVLDILKNNQGISKEYFITQVQKLYRKVYDYDKQCRGNNCYHPEVLGRL